MGEINTSPNSNTEKSPYKLVPAIRYFSSYGKCYLHREMSKEVDSRKLRKHVLFRNAKGGNEDLKGKLVDEESLYEGVKNFDGYYFERALDIDTVIGKAQIFVSTDDKNYSRWFSDFSP